MRLWTIHPKYLDAKGLVALWREALLAQAVLRNKTRGYKHHPQLIRFRAHPRPAAVIAMYLACVLEEAQARGYNFDVTKVGRRTQCDPIEETRGQLAYEWEHLRKKLEKRDPDRLRVHAATRTPHTHPLFILVRGQVREWERVTPTQSAAAKNKPKAKRSSRRAAKARPSLRPSRRSPS